MTDHTELIERLQSRTASMYLLEDVNLFHEAADALEAAQAEIERLTTDRRVLQADGKHPAPCAKFCEATAFTIELRRVRAERDKALARIAELTKQEPVAEMALVDMGIGDARQLRVNWLMDGYLDVGAKLFAAAGASPQPSQAGELSDRHISELKATSIILRKSDGPVTFIAKKLQIADAIDASIAAIKGVS